MTPGESYFFTELETGKILSMYVCDHGTGYNFYIKFEDKLYRFHRSGNVFIFLLYNPFCNTVFF